MLLMKKTELRKIIVTYCDICGKEITGNYTSITKKDDTRLDFCSDKCLDKYKKERDKK